MVGYISNSSMRSILNTSIIFFKKYQFYSLHASSETNVAKWALFPWSRLHVGAPEENHNGSR